MTAELVRRLHRAMKDTPVEANRTLTALSAVFGYADRAELVPARSRYAKPNGLVRGLN